MGADEEYLDNLLKSVTEGMSPKKTEENEPEVEVPEAEEIFKAEEVLGAEEIFEAEEVSVADLFAGAGFDDSLETVSESVSDADSENATVQSTPPETGGANEENVLDIDAMLRELNLLDADFQEPNLINTSEESANAEESTVSQEPVIPDQIFVDHVADLSEEDIDRILEKNQELPSDWSDLLDSLATDDSDVAEINELLEKADNNEAVSEDVLALYSAVSANAEMPEQETDNAGALKKAEKERKRKEKAQQKADKKAAKLEAKMQKKMAKKAVSEVSAISGADAITADGITEENLNSRDVSDSFEPVPEEPQTTFDEYQEVDDFADIQSLLGSLNLDELQFEAAPAENIATKDSIFEGDGVFELGMDELQDVDIPTKPGESKGKKEKGKKEKIKKEKAEKEGGFFKKFLNALFEEAEDGEEKAVQADGSVDINAENNAIMDELDKEDKKAGKKKKDKSNKKKGKDTEDSEDEDGKKKGKKSKKKKEPKVPKEKFKPIDDEKPGKKIAKGGIIAVMILAASVFAVIFLSNIVFSPFLGKQRAKKAFEQQDYEAAYQEFAGWNLNEEEERMRDFSEVVLKMDRRITAYDQYQSLRKKLEALDSLMRAVEHYEEIYQEALNCGAEGEVEKRYETILGLLSEEYNLSEDEAKRIVMLSSDVEYTKYLTAVIEGKSISDLEDESEELPGLLPEEEELPDINFSE